MMGWLPIDSAPVDVDVLVSGGTYGCEDVGCEFYNVEFKGVAIASRRYSEDSIFEGDGLMIYCPLGWQPLPDPITDGGPGSQCTTPTGLAMQLDSESSRLKERIRQLEGHIRRYRYHPRISNDELEAARQKSIDHLINGKVSHAD